MSGDVGVGCRWLWPGVVMMVATVVRYGGGCGQVMMSTTRRKGDDGGADSGDGCVCVLVETEVASGCSGGW